MMESNASKRRAVQVVRVLCDGCEKTCATAYCSACSEAACAGCVDQLHVKGRRGVSKKVRTCKGNSIRDLGRSVAVIAMCKSCRSRPAYVCHHLFFFRAGTTSVIGSESLLKRCANHKFCFFYVLQKYNSVDASPYCKECRNNRTSDLKRSHDVMKTALADDLRRSKSSSSRQRQKGTASSDGDSTGNDSSFSHASSTE